LPGRIQYFHAIYLILKGDKEMRHPFDLDKDELQALDLNSLKDLTDAESESMSGGQTDVSTMAMGEEGGDATTLAVGEEGGDATTLALGEEGGGWSIPWPGNFPCGDMPSPF
jgi:hypothetical protein